MIIAYIGRPGQGKSLSLARKMRKRSYNSFTNFDTVGLKGCERIRIDQILKKVPVQFYKDGSPKKFEEKVNWEFWNRMMEEGGYDIYLDELHLLVNSRRGQKGLNIALNDWVSQIRKILGESEKNNLYLSTQRPMSIDPGFRDLVEFWVVCKKRKVKDKVFIFNHFFFNVEEALEFFYGKKVKPRFSRFFLGNNYFKYYRSYEIIEEGYL